MRSIEETCSALMVLGPSARVLAGGTDLIVSLRGAEPKEDVILLDIGTIPGLGEIREEERALVIGSLASFAQIALSPLVRQLASPLAGAAARMGNPQVRNRATIGGNICNASPCADSVPALIALDARLHFVSTEGEHLLPVEETIDGPYSTTVPHDALLTDIVIPKLPAGALTSYVRLARRQAAAKARMAVAVVLVPDEKGNLVDVRIGCGSVTPRPHRMRKAEGRLLGSVPTDERLAASATDVAAEMIQETGIRWSTEYKEPAVKALTRRALREALGWD
ncbi:MAG: FAD binding domain-containing protein [Candidatus Eisenbacteria sp.]|nr:FAD binding domain-containing protein [Candidatus Eisenbacteria bacterium]